MRMQWSVVLAAPFLLIACQQPNEDAQRGGEAHGLVTYGDSLVCGRVFTMYRNNSVNPKDVHVEATYSCTEVDTIRPPGGHLVVKDMGNNRVLQDVLVDPGPPYRGTITVPVNAKLDLECPGTNVLGGSGCKWSISYSP